MIITEDDFGDAQLGESVGIEADRATDWNEIAQSAPDYGVNPQISG